MAASAGAACHSAPEADIATSEAADSSCASRGASEGAKPTVKLSTVLAAMGISQTVGAGTFRLSVGRYISDESSMITACTR